MAEDKNYLDIGFNNFLQQEGNNLDYLLGSAPASGVSQNGATGQEDGVSEPEIKDGSSLADLWITNSIKSKDWKPKTTGFYLNGQTGYAEFSDVYVSGKLEATSIDIPDSTTADSFHVNSDGDAWWGAAAIGDAVAKILKTGIVTFMDVNIGHRIVAVATTGNIQTTIDLVSAGGGGIVHLRAGTFTVDYDIVLPSNVVLEGEGMYKTIIDFNNNAKQIQILGTLKTIAGTFAIDTEVSPTTVNGTGTAFTSAVAGDFLWIVDDWYEIASITSATVLVLVEVYPVSVTSETTLIYTLKQKIEIKDLTVQNSHFTTDYDGSGSNPANGNIYIKAARQLYFENIRSIDSDNTTALYPAYGCFLNITSHLKFRNVEFLKNHSDGFCGVSTSYISFEQCYFNQNGASGAYLDSIKGEENLFLGCVFNNNPSSNGVLRLGNAYIAKNIKVIGNTFKNNSGAVVLAGASGSGRIIVMGNKAESGITISSGSNNNVVIGNDFTSGTVSDSGIGNILKNNKNSLVTEEKSFVKVRNTSGGDLAAGDVVILKSAAAGNEVATTTTGGDNKVFAMVVETIVSTSWGMVQILGKTTVLKVDGTTDIAIGDWLTTFTTAKIACKAVAGNMIFAMALEAYTANDSNGVIDALIVSPRLI